MCRIIPSKSKGGKSSFSNIGSHSIQTKSWNQPGGVQYHRTFKFDKVFNHQCRQNEIFDEVKTLIQSSMEGYNVCIMSYGQTGSGKTYTMVGDDKNPGLYFNSVDEIYGIIKSNRSHIDYDVSVSVIEIYNEQIRDLLRKD